MTAVICLSAANLYSAEDTATNVDVSKLSEAFGHFIGKNLTTSGLNLDINAFVKGVQDGASGKPAPMSEQDYQKGMMILQQQAMKKLADENLAAANKFLAENKAKSGVVVLEEGKLQYKVLQPGSGDAVKEHGSPKLTYKGSYIDGTVFGSSEDAGGSIVLPLDHTIAGFSKALIGMKEGEKREIYVHPDLGYGTSGQLPPNSLLIFDVEILKADSPVDQEAGLQLTEDDSDLDDEDEGETDDESDDEGDDEREGI